MGRGGGGWKVTDCKICFEYGLYYSPVSTPRRLSAAFPYRIGAGFKKSRDRTIRAISPL